MPDAGLIARGRELAHLDDLLWRARGGTGGVVGLHGESGVGKSSLIEAAIARAAEFRVVQIRGRSDPGSAATPADWPRPLADLASRLEIAGDTQLAAWAAGAAPSAPPPPKRAVVQAVAGTLQEMVVAAGGPLLLTIDDCQALPTWFVDAVGRAVAGHLSTDPVSVVLAWKDLPHVVPFHPVERDLPRHRLAGLTEGQAAQLLSTRFDRLPGPAVLAELVAGTGGNPLALVEVYGRLTADQIEGWQPLPDPLPVGSLVAEAFDVAAHLPTATRQALAVVAAARAPRETLLAVLDGVGIDPADLAPATDAGVLVERGPRVDFAHPLVRAAAFFCAPASVRRAARQVLSNELARQHAIESSAFHAAADADGPDDAVSRRLAQAAQAALERGDPEAAARYEERASRFATGDDAVVLHMATAAGLWITAGRRDRARRCVDVVGHHHVSDPVAGELAYQRARLVPETAGADVADQIAAAADGCVAGAPNRAVAMLVDAAAWKLLAGELLAAETVVQRAGALAASVSSQAEVLVGAMRAATLLAQGQDVEALAERSRISLLIGQTERFPSSPEVALVVGTSLIRQGMWRQAERWAHWVERCAAGSGDRALAAVPFLLRASIHLDEGRLADAGLAVDAGAALAEQRGSVAVAAWAWSVATQLHALTGDHRRGFRDCAKLFAVADPVARPARLRAMPALALLELVQGRVGPALAWVRTVEEDLAHLGGNPGGPSAGAALDVVTTEIAAPAAAVLLLARATVGPGRWTGAAHPPDGLPDANGDPSTDQLNDRGQLDDRGHARGGHARTAGWRHWLDGACCDDVDRSVDQLAAASDAFGDAPLVQARVDLCLGVRLADAGRTDEARARLDRVERRADEAGATGVAALARRELARLQPAVAEAATTDGTVDRAVVSGAAIDGMGVATAATVPPAPVATMAHDAADRDLGRFDVAASAVAAAASAPTVGPAAASSVGPVDGVPVPGAPEWELILLGGFEVRHRGRLIALPASLAAQAVKIVGLQQRITVDELVELLWEDAEPGVGARRLRNVLWRIRSSCGELLQRDGNVVHLAPGAVTDVERFRGQAEKALDPAASPTEAGRKARVAADGYRGELLPADRYADWATGTRESVARTYLRLLDLLVDEAVAEGRGGEAVDLLGSLAAADPYDERHFVRMAEIHLELGNRGRALDALGKAERVLEDLGVAPSSPVEHLREQLGRS